ncbi:MAG: hypothetical protein ACXVRK_12975 [Gaiellaceae bacterium]
MSEIGIALVAIGPALVVGGLLLWFDRWRIANDWRYTAVPWRKRRHLV